jgi:hypothetical protein
MGRHGALGGYRSRWHDLLFAAVLVFGIVTQLMLRPWSTPITWDGFGYHLYLPLIFVHQDLGMVDPGIIPGIFEQYRPSDTFYQAHLAPTGHMVIRYTPGLALLHLPGFLIAHIVAHSGTYPADGLSLPYQLAATTTAMSFLLVGLWALLRVLHRYFKPTTAYLTAALILYGTNLMDQAVEQQMMTHLYSFALYSLLLLTTARFHERPGANRAFATGLVLGVLVLVRPTNALAVLIPLLWPMPGMGIADKLRWVWGEQRSMLLAALAGAIPPVLLLLGYWRAYSGDWLYDSYQNPGEGLDLFYPHIHKFLFSFRKGWFIYTPIMLVALAGLLFLRRGAVKRLCFSLLLFLFTFIYVVSSWTLWYYPGGFGQRAAVDIYPIMALGLGAVVEHVLNGSAWRKWAALAGFALLVALLQFQIMQQRWGVRPADRLTWSYYWSSFLDKAPDPTKAHLMLYERPTTQVNELPAGHGPVQGATWSQPTPDLQGLAPDGSPAHVLSIDTPYSPAFKLPYREITKADHAWLVVSGSVLIADSSAMEGCIVAHMDHGGAYGYRAWDLRTIPGIRPGEWTPFRFVYLTPVPRRPWDPLVTYAWHRGGSVFWAKEFQVELHAPIH